MTRRRDRAGTSAAQSKGRARGDRGSAMIEFAILTPLLFLILFGIIDFGYTLYQDLDVRHGSREAARLTAVNYTTAGHTGAQQSTDIIAAACQRMDATSSVTVTLAFSGTGQARADTATVTVEKPNEELTGYLHNILGGKTLTSTVTSRLEQDATWAAVTDQACP